jgi:hypothetical protein
MWCPGSEEELRRWGLGFPRAWVFGVPVAFDEDGFLAAEEDNVHRVDGPKEDEYVDTGGLGKRVLGSKSGLSSTMSMNLKDDYAEWLRGKGYQFAQIFGHVGAAARKAGSQ